MGKFYLDEEVLQKELCSGCELVHYDITRPLADPDNETACPADHSDESQWVFTDHCEIECRFVVEERKKY